MKPKFEIGDRVRYIAHGVIGTVICVDADHNGYDVRYDVDDSEEYYVDEKDIEFENPRLTFLTRLQELLKTFDAEFVAIIGEDNTDYEDKPKVFIQIGDETMNYERDNHAFCDITAENVFDYDND